MKDKRIGARGDVGNASDLACFVVENATGAACFVVENATPQLWNNGDSG